VGKLENLIDDGIELQRTALKVRANLLWRAPCHLGLACQRERKSLIIIKEFAESRIFVAAEGFARGVHFDRSSVNLVRLGLIEN